jgi:hypothetical protein
MSEARDQAARERPYFRPRHRHAQRERGVSSGPANVW